MILRDEAQLRPENREEFLLAKNLPKMTFKQSIKALIFSRRINPAEIQSFRPRL